MPSILVEHLTRRFGPNLALDDFSLKVEPGKICFILGPSGCGKTTLLRSVAGLLQPDAGRIYFGEEDVTDLPPEKRNCGMVFQGYALWPHLTVAQNLAFGLEERRVPGSEIRTRVEKTLATVHLPGFGTRRLQELSGGQRQRVALARALIIRPCCLLLDEPLSSIDSNLRLEVRREIRRICREASLTVIYVTHDRQEATSSADQVAVLRAGRLLQSGTPSELYLHPKTRFVAEFMGDTNLLPGTVIRTSATSTTVQTGIGEFVAKTEGTNFQAAQKVLLSIRPEHWRADQAPTGPNCVSGRLLTEEFRGDTSDFTLAPEAAEAPHLKLRILNGRGRLKCGDHVSAVVAIEDITILHEEEERTLKS